MTIRCIPFAVLVAGRLPVRRIETTAPRRERRVAPAAPGVKVLPIGPASTVVAAPTPRGVGLGDPVMVIESAGFAGW